MVGPVRLRRSSRGLFPMALLATAGLAACGAEDGNQDELQALLHDEDLVSLTSGALTDGTGASSGVGTGSGGATGVGTGGSGGGIVPPSPDAGVMTGAGGSRPVGDGGATGGFGGGAVDASPTGMGGFFGDGGLPPPFGPFGQWPFDDCSPFRTNLFDQGPNGNTAFRSIGVTCAGGVAGQAVSLAAKEDIVYVPDQPNFTFENGITVAGWFNPTSTSQVRTLFRKRDRGTSSFAMVLNGGRFQFVINLGGGRAASVVAPKKAKVGIFQHVAGTYDGAMLKLYVDGAEVASLNVSGSIPPGPGPFLMGNDGSERRFDGLIDNTFFDGRALSASEVTALTCIRQQPTMDVNPRESAPTPANVPATFDIAVTNHNSASCAPETYQFEEFNFFPGISVDPSPFFAVASPPVASGETTHFTMTAVASDTVDPGSFPLSFQIFSFDPFSNVFLFDTVQFVVAEPTGCHVNTSRELMIKNVSVVDDRLRTNSFGPPDDPRTGAWTFKHLMENMAPTPADAPSMVEDMLRTFTTPQTVNGFTLAPRPGMQSLILDAWPRTADGQLDLAQAPLQLQAIVNRFDLRQPGSGDAGEGRFVFAFLAPGAFFPLQATLIFEYKLPAATPDEVTGWANAWHALGSMPFSEDYNAALQALTERFVGRGARPGHPNDNAINAVRTNEIDFGDNGIWQLREFTLSPDTGRLTPATIKLTPDRSFNNTSALAAFVNANEASIIAETHDVPEIFDGQSFLAGAVFNDLTSWAAPGINDNEARHHFAVNTCNGCHSAAETGTFFLQISPRFFGGEAALSGFLTGITVRDPVTDEPRTFNDLARRLRDLSMEVCGTAPPPPVPPPAPPPSLGGDGTGGAGGAFGGGTTGSAGSGGADGMIPPPKVP